MNYFKNICQKRHVLIFRISKLNKVASNILIQDNNYQKVQTEKKSLVPKQLKTCANLMKSFLVPKAESFTSLGKKDMTVDEFKNSIIANIPKQQEYSQKLEEQKSSFATKITDSEFKALKTDTVELMGKSIEKMHKKAITNFFFNLLKISICVAVLGGSLFLTGPLFLIFLGATGCLVANLNDATGWHFFRKQPALFGLNKDKKFIEIEKKLLTNIEKLKSLETIEMDFQEYNTDQDLLITNLGARRNSLKEDPQSRKIDQDEIDNFLITTQKEIQNSLKNKTLTKLEQVLDNSHKLVLLGICIAAPITVGISNGAAFGSMTGTIGVLLSSCLWNWPKNEEILTNNLHVDAHQSVKESSVTVDDMESDETSVSVEEKQKRDLLTLEKRKENEKLTLDKIKENEKLILAQIKENQKLTLAKAKEGNRLTLSQRERG